MPRVRTLKLVLALTTCLFGLFSPQSSFAGKLIDKSQDGYWLSLPKAFSPDQKNPVLVCLPGRGISAKQDINVWSFPANKAGFVVVDFDVNYDSIKSEKDIENLYERLVATVSSLSATYPIETDKIYIAGTSAGGMMSISLALRHPERFSAISVVSGGSLRFGAENYLKNAEGSLFYMLHGQNDKIVSIGKFYAAKQQLEKNGAVVQSKVISDGEHTLRSGFYNEMIDWLAKSKVHEQPTK